MIIVNGLHFEGWLERLISASGYHGRIVVATTGIRPRLLNNQPDPHAWQSLSNGRIYVDNIRAALIAAIPAHADQINYGAAMYLRDIDKMERSVRQRFRSIPDNERRVITSHDAFGYFGADYGIEFLSPQGWSTDSEPSAAKVAAIIEQIKLHRVRAVFIENITDPRLVEHIARDAGAIRGGTLYSDALSAPGTAADSYLKMFDSNAATLVNAMRRASQPPSYEQRSP
jgi:zinc/manganese transport system substrate-binding protein